MLYNKIFGIFSMADDRFKDQVNIYGDKLETGFRDEEGHNALDLAVQQSNMELFNLLLKYSAVTHISSLILAV